MLIFVEQCLSGETQQRVKNWQRLKYLARCKCGFMVLETPSPSPSCLTWCCLCSMMQKRRKRLPAAIVGPFPVVITALSSSDRYPDPALCADITPRQVQLTEKPVSLLLNKAVQGSCTLFSAQTVLSSLAVN